MAAQGGTKHVRFHVFFIKKSSKFTKIIKSATCLFKVINNNNSYNSNKLMG